MANYPQYRLRYVGTGVPNSPVSTNGSHTFRLDAPKSGVRVTLSQNDESSDAFPNLILTFEDVD
jgi:hypothetical protein